MRADLSRLEDLQRAMICAVHGDVGAFGATSAWIEATDVSPDKLLFIHLNTINHALIAVLQQAYPATARFLGSERFADLAKVFLRRTPPRCPVLSAYGTGFAAFLAETGALSESMAALARLDWAAHEAYFAAAAISLTRDRLAAVPPGEHVSLPLRLVPSARLVPLGHGDVWERWTALQPPGEISVSGPTEPDVSAALVWRRPDLRVAARSLNAGEAAFFQALDRGKCLLEAAQIADEAQDVDLSGLLAFSLTAGVFRDFDADGP